MYDIAIRQYVAHGRHETSNRRLSACGTFETKTEPQNSFCFWPESWPFSRLCPLL